METVRQTETETDVKPLNFQTINTFILSGTSCKHTYI